MAHRRIDADVSSHSIAPKTKGKCRWRCLGIQLAGGKFIQIVTRTLAIDLRLWTDQQPPTYLSIELKDRIGHALAKANKEAADDVTNAESENDKFDMKIEYDYWSRESVL